MDSRFCYTDGNIQFRELVTRDEIDEAYRLRYLVCVQLLGWVDGYTQFQMEWDEWDEREDLVWHFGAFINGELVGYVRLVKDNATHDIMSRKCFQELFRCRDPRPPVEMTGDISRLILRPGLGRGLKRAERTKYIEHLMLGLYRLAYGRARLEGIRFWYFVTSGREIAALYKELFPVNVLGVGITSDKKRTYVALLDLKHACRILRFVAPRRLAWYDSVVNLVEQLPAPPQLLEPAIADPLKPLAA